MKRLSLLLILLLLAPPVSGGMHHTGSIDLQGEPEFLAVGPGGGVVAWRDGELYFLQEGGLQANYTTTDNVIALAVDYKAQRAALIEGEQVVIYGAAEGVLLSASTPGEEPVAVALSSAGNYVGAGFADGSVRLWYISGGEIELRWTFPNDEQGLNDEQRQQIHHDLQESLRLVLSSDYMAVAGSSQLYVVRRNDGGLKGVLGKYTFNQKPLDLAMSSDGRVIAVATPGKLHAYILESSERKWKFATPEVDSSRALAVAPDGSLIVLLHGNLTQVVSGFDPDSGEPDWNHDLAGALATARPRIAASESRVAVAGLGADANDLTVLDHSGQQVGRLLTESQSPLVGASGSKIVITTPQGVAFYATPPAGAQANWLPVDTRTLGLVAGALLLVAAIGAVWWFELLELPFGGAPPPMPPTARQTLGTGSQPLASRFSSSRSALPVTSAPLKVKPVITHGTATIACPGCGAQMEVPKLGRIQKVECGECGVAGNAEI